MYPFLRKIKERLDKEKKTLKWLADEVGITTKTFNNNPSISTHSLEFISKVSAALEFDFLKDYNEWLLANNEEPIAVLNDHETSYKKDKGITVEIKVTASYNTFGLHFGELLKIIQKEGDKLGFRIE